MNNPRYFVAVFGDPEPEGKNVVDSGIYDPDPRYAPFPTKPGDFLLLYCTERYPQRPKEISGIGIILTSDEKCITYRWLPFREPISKKIVDQAFETSDTEKFKNIWMASHWLFEISQTSFSKTVTSQLIDWDGL